MKLTFDANNTKVYDNILDQKTFNALFDFMNFVPMVHKRSRGEWNRVWGFNDGDILMANRYIWPRGKVKDFTYPCLLYTSPSPRDAHESRMPSSA